jgi:hypothetical protein
MSDDNSYALRQAQRDAQHAEDYRRWVDTLPEAERAKLRGLGIDQPDTSYSGSSCLMEMDLAESPLAASVVCFDDYLEASSPPDPKGFVESEKSALSSAIEARLCSDALASFCARMRGCMNPALVFDAVCYGTGVLAMEGQSATDLAKKHGVTKQAFSKIAVEWCMKFGLPPSRAMKSKRSRVAYRKRAKAVHQRNKLTTESPV